MDRNGRSSFQALQGALKGRTNQTIDYHRFRSSRVERRGPNRTSSWSNARPSYGAIVPEGTPPPALLGSHRREWRETAGTVSVTLDLEGVISKKADGRYIGSRSGGWLKTKCIKRQEFVDRRLDAVRQIARLSIANPRRSRGRRRTPLRRARSAQVSAWTEILRLMEHDAFARAGGGDRQRAP
jgi:hypothetical protein